ncbi:uncharacterized protein LAESUDRAFT_755002 [Laetiporus sulphureus 93-53]|uniref:Uncharacterized protein n=1 Tax=Laetiporus sulphureus 93-53 TaxID=1314785 RepID=A0A165H785_9APHY|nr:uncharacterized protein LAESUDRAFT_755002 [Laetiporus sulphureus 93-53]KZT11341.1 hypothetical protein LAESUDRAFT_755002 [Laetiporus sulphureus 93-53]
MAVLRSTRPSSTSPHTELMAGAAGAFSAVPGAIPKPLLRAEVVSESSVGKVTLREQMGIDIDEFRIFTQIVRDSTSLHLAAHRTVKKQNPQSLIKHYNEIKRKWAKADLYENVWPAHAYTQLYLAERTAHYHHLYRTSGKKKMQGSAVAAHPMAPVREQNSRGSHSAGPRIFIGKLPPRKVSTSSRSTTARRTVSSVYSPQPRPMSSISRPPASMAPSSTSKVSLQCGPPGSANNDVEDETQEVYVFLQSLDLPLGHLLPSFVSSGVKNMMRLRLLTKHRAWEDYVERHITKDRFEILMLEKGFKELVAEN